METIKIAIVLCVIQTTVFCGSLEIRHQAERNGDLKKLREASDLALQRSLHAAFHSASSTQNVQNDTQTIVSDLEQSLSKALEDIEHTIKEATARWNKTIQEVVAFVKTVNRAQDDCVLSGTPLDNATISFKSDLVFCFKDDVDTIIDLLEKADEIQWKSDNLIRLTLHTINLCGQSNLPSNLVCWIENLPRLIESTISLVAEVEATEVEATNLIGLLDFKTGVCVIKAFIIRSRETGDIIEDSFKCFSDHMSTK